MPATIRNHPQSPATGGPDAGALALAALGWILSDDDRATRFLALTGLTPDDLRGALAEPTTQAAVLEFLANHEPDMLRASEALAVAPGDFTAALAELSS